MGNQLFSPGQALRVPFSGLSVIDWHAANQTIFGSTRMSAFHP